MQRRHSLRRHRRTPARRPLGPPARPRRRLAAGCRLKASLGCPQMLRPAWFSRRWLVGCRTARYLRFPGQRPGTRPATDRPQRLESPGNPVGPFMASEGERSWPPDTIQRNGRADWTLMTTIHAGTLVPWGLKCKIPPAPALSGDAYPRCLRLRSSKIQPRDDPGNWGPCGRAATRRPDGRRTR